MTYAFENDLNKMMMMQLSNYFFCIFLTFSDKRIKKKCNVELTIICTFHYDYSYESIGIHQFLLFL